MSIYRIFFRLSKDPFSLTPDPDMLYPTEQHREALAGLAYAVAHRKGFMVLVGPAGTGKTTLVRKALQSMRCLGVQSSVILNPTLTPGEFLEAVLLDFGITEIPASKAQRIWLLQKLLLEWHAQQKTIALIVDEAHMLSPALLEEVRLLGNLELAHQKLLQIVLVGQPELADVLNRQDLHQLKQRIAVRVSISALSAEGVAGYLECRWKKAGAQASLPFAPEAIQAVTRVSAGIPRLINTICDNALLLAFSDTSETVKEEHVMAACRDLELMPVALPASASSQNGKVGAPAAQVPAASPPALAENPSTNDDLPPIRVLAGYEQKPSWWGRWVARVGLA